MVGLGTNCTTTADEEKAIEILQKVKTKMADNIKRYELHLFLACCIGNILGLFSEPAAVQSLKSSIELRELLAPSLWLRHQSDISVGRSI
jgi:hypothetical protein